MSVYFRSISSLRCFVWLTVCQMSSAPPAAVANTISTQIDTTAPLRPAPPAGRRPRHDAPPVYRPCEGRARRARRGRYRPPGHPRSTRPAAAAPARLAAHPPRPRPEPPDARRGPARATAPRPAARAARCPPRIAARRGRQYDSGRVDGRAQRGTAGRLARQDLRIPRPPGGQGQPVGAAGASEAQRKMAETVGQPARGEGEGLRRLIRDVPDFPKPGILFKDITPLLADASGLALAVELLVQPFRGRHIDLVVGAESRGFIFGTAAATALSAGFVPVRKPGKLPAAVRRHEYGLEYGTDALEIHADALRPGQRVLIVDDLLATGGTLAACCELVRASRASIEGVAVLIELRALGGRRQLGSVPVWSVLAY